MINIITMVMVVVCSFTTVIPDQKIEDIELPRMGTEIEEFEIFKEIEFEYIEPEVIEEPEPSGREVIFSNYWQDATTASGLTPSDFKVNSMGMYTYQGKVVVATANTTRMPHNLPYNFKSNELYDEMTLTFRGVNYEAIVLDVCGTCTWGKKGETLQRVDIFTTHKIMGVERGVVYE